MTSLSATIWRAAAKLALVLLAVFTLAFGAPQAAQALPTPSYDLALMSVHPTKGTWEPWERFWQPSVLSWPEYNKEYKKYNRTEATRIGRNELVWIPVPVGSVSPGMPGVAEVKSLTATTVATVPPAPAVAVPTATIETSIDRERIEAIAMKAADSASKRLGQSIEKAAEQIAAAIKDGSSRQVQIPVPTGITDQQLKEVREAGFAAGVKEGYQKASATVGLPLWTMFVVLLLAAIAGFLLVRRLKREQRIREQKEQELARANVAMSYLGEKVTFDLGGDSRVIPTDGVYERPFVLAAGEKETSVLIPGEIGSDGRPLIVKRSQLEHYLSKPANGSVRDKLNLALRDPIPGGSPDEEERGEVEKVA